jgi:acyl-coenzyme A synthetase/AMP-(fatty) acid ligase
MTLAIDRRADLWGTRTAVVEHQTGERVSYADLAVLIDDTAGRLAALGVGADDTIAVVSRNRIEVLALLFATRRLGAVFAPLPHRLTPATSEPAIEAVDPALVVHETAQRDLVGGIEADRRVSFEELDGVEGGDYERVERDPESPLWYLRTDELLRAGRRRAVGDERGQVDERSDLDREQVRQGTAAGESRGGRTVVVPERQAEWNCVSAAVAWGLGREDRAPILVPFASADGLLRLALPLLYVGGTVIVQRAADPADTLALVNGGMATRLFGSATVLRELSEVDGFADADWSVVDWVASGDPLDSDVVNAFRVEGVPVIRSYGRPEAGPNALFVPPELADGTEPHGAVGRPFPDAAVRIVGEDGEPVEPGVVGELHVGGRVVASGYLDSEDGGGSEGDETFRDGWVATGESARRDPDSGLVVLEGDGVEPVG